MKPNFDISMNSITEFEFARPQTIDMWLMPYSGKPLTTEQREKLDEMLKPYIEKFDLSSDKFTEFIHTTRTLWEAEDQTGGLNIQIDNGTR